MRARGSASITSRQIRDRAPSPTRMTRTSLMRPRRRGRRGPRRAASSGSPSSAASRLGRIGALTGLRRAPLDPRAGDARGDALGQREVAHRLGRAEVDGRGPAPGLHEAQERGAEVGRPGPVAARVVGGDRQRLAPPRRPRSRPGASRPASGWSAAPRRARRGSRAAPTWASQTSPSAPGTSDLARPLGGAVGPLRGGGVGVGQVGRAVALGEDARGGEEHEGPRPGAPRVAQEREERRDVGRHVLGRGDAQRVGAGGERRAVDHDVGRGQVAQDRVVAARSASTRSAPAAASRAAASKARSSAVTAAAHRHEARRDVAGHEAARAGHQDASASVIRSARRCGRGRSRSRLRVCSEMSRTARGASPASMAAHDGRVVGGDGGEVGALGVPQRHDLVDAQVEIVPELEQQVVVRQPDQGPVERLVGRR